MCEKTRNDEGIGGDRQLKLAPVRVDLGARSYEVFFSQDWKEILKTFAGRRIMIITDSNVAPLHLQFWRELLPEAEFMLLPPGERSKSAFRLGQIHTFLIERKFDRQSLVIALGGGMIGDLAGFASATYLRGVDFLQIPTTLLAMVDAAIGGKVGINHRLGKNLIGAFHQPKAVLIESRHLSTLPEREWFCGLGEVIKYGLISDKKIFRKIGSSLEKKLPPEKWITMEEIRRCVQIKAKIVSTDEREVSGPRMILNFGHTLGHGLESATNYKIFKHGEAVAVGMMGAVLISLRKNLIPKDLFESIISVLQKFPLPAMKTPVDANIIYEFVRRDKKVEKSQNRMTLLEDIGKAVILNNIEEKLLKEGIDFALKCLTKS
jgi:3-dehydroquinate synthase